ncbi:Methyltransferase domain-containing protein [Salinihabitans flavidus]|uniref:Methyltransferase domain-containing protein n=1 Tax=Salinihabitans flavidus TaxID=569882 RepID=A0A1H8QC89_9RHOB|nr:methyltransferase domain-containing protein [Salinihabitans flavidus]SEO51676.1 Methyltransferase domain-containing protein [Salinihabitans flavidus]
MPGLNRIVMNRTSRRWLRALDLENMDIGEISGQWGKGLGGRSYVSLRYPDYDICKGAFADEQGRPLSFDLILANQVWEHLDRPYAATRNVRGMLREGGYFWLAVPFFIPYHPAPQDCSRWSARGLKNLLIEGGFDAGQIRSGQWGNRQVAARNLEEDWPPVYDPERDDLENDHSFPICSWALARKI